MIRRQTWVLVAILILLLGVVFYLQRNPLPPSGAEITPSATSPASLLPGFGAQDIMYVSIKNGEDTIELSNNGGRWVLLPGNKAVEAGKVEEIRAQLADMHVMANLPASFDPETGGLTKSTRMISLRNSQGSQVDMKIGDATPTGDGYYVQINSNAPVVVNKGSIDVLLEQISLSNLAPTPTLEVTPAADLTGTPNP